MTVWLGFCWEIKKKKKVTDYIVCWKIDRIINFPVKP
jgi:hypothetical protein